MNKTDLHTKATEYAQDKVDSLTIKKLTIKEIKNLIILAYKDGYAACISDDDITPSTPTNPWSTPSPITWPPYTPNAPLTTPFPSKPWEHIIYCTADTDQYGHFNKRMFY